MFSLKKGFKSRLLISYLLVVIVSFGFISFFLSTHLEDKLLQEIKTSLIKQAYLVESQINKQFLQKDAEDALFTRIKVLSDTIQSRITLIDRNGKVIADSERAPRELPMMENHASRPEVRAAFNGEVGIDTRFSATLKVEMLYVALPIRDRSAVVGAVRLALPLDNVRSVLSGVRHLIGWALLFALGLAFVVGSILASGIVKPLNRIIRVSRKYAQGDFSRRIELNSQDEISELARTLNGMAADIEDKIREITLRNQQLGAIFSSMIEGVIVVDRSNRIISVNPSVERIFGVSRELSERKLFLEAIRNNDLAEIISSVLEKGEPVSGELSLQWPVQGDFRINATPIFAGGAVNGCLIVIHDITQMRKLERMRSDFIANISHELKTPLTSIKGFVETLLEGALEDKENSRDFLRIVQEHTERLTNLINDLLQLSYLESRHAALDTERVNLRALAELVLSGFTAQIKKKHLRVSNDLDKEVVLSLDKEKMQQVFTNFLDNAIKFNKDGGSIRLSHEQLNGAIKIVVEDSGVGIPKKDCDRIFERFYRVDKARSRALGGTGLGLSIVKHIIELHGGSVGVESSEGFGSSFWFILPLEGRSRIEA
jgi:two-component system phosphate regulon sensor histidine kinase PhoR